MARKHASKSWTGKVPSDKYYRDWADKLGVSGKLGFLSGIGALIFAFLYWWFTEA